MSAQSPVKRSPVCIRVWNWIKHWAGLWFESLSRMPCQDILCQGECWPPCNDLIDYENL